MTAYQIIYDEAIGNYGLFSTERAKELGISNGTLAKLAHRGRLEHLGYGLYRIDKFVPNANGLDAYACADWEETYEAANVRHGVARSLDEAVAWANDLVGKLDDASRERPASSAP